MAPARWLSGADCIETVCSWKQSALYHHFSEQLSYLVEENTVHFEKFIWNLEL